MAAQVQLKGHRSVGGMRASVYNSMPLSGAETLAAFMQVLALSRLELSGVDALHNLFHAGQGLCHCVMKFYHVPESSQSAPCCGAGLCQPAYKLRTTDACATDLERKHEGDMQETVALQGVGLAKKRLLKGVSLLFKLALNTLNCCSQGYAGYALAWY